MIVIARRSVWRPMVEVFTPSIVISPSASSYMRNRASIMELLPDPVRPHTPTLLSGGMSVVMRCIQMAHAGRGY